MDTNNLVQYLVMVSNSNLLLNFGMHLLILVSVLSVFLLKSGKARKYAVKGTILVLFATVAANAIIYGNPFHAITFGIMTVMTALVLIKDQNEMKVPRLGIRTIASLFFVLLGIWYPELVKTNILGSILLSPVGMVPCPTLITALGLLGLAHPVAYKKYYMALVFFGMVYGFIGTFKLGVWFDLYLIAAVIFTVGNMAAGMTAKGNRGLKHKEALQ